MKRGFTIIELLTAVAIIAVLLTIVVTASAGAIRSARLNRAQAMSRALEQGINAYYAQNNKWPGAIETRGVNESAETVTFSSQEEDKIFQEVVGAGFGKSSGVKSMLVDASALFVARSSRLGNGGKRHVGGVDFMMAANRNSKFYINFSDMAFGYQDPEYGNFCRFHVTYFPKTDMVSVTYPMPKDK